MSQETEKTEKNLHALRKLFLGPGFFLTQRKVEKDIKKDPSLRKLVNEWLIALFLILLAFPFLCDFLELFTGIPAKLSCPTAGIGYLFYIVTYTILFLLKRKRFTGQEISQNNKLVDS